MVIFDALFGTVLGIISVSGYAGIFILMVLESMVFPVPSEAVLPFAGFLIATGQMNLAAVGIVSTIGSIVGSLISYYIGLKGGRAFVKRYGKYFLLSEKNLENAHRFFEKRGEITILVSRFIPVIRHLISIPAGYAEMSVRKFIAFTAIGAAIWNTVLVYSGIALKDNWEIIISYTQYLDIAVALAIVALLAYFVFRKAAAKAP